MSDDAAITAASVEPTEDQIRQAYDRMKARPTASGFSAGHYPYLIGCLLAHIEMIARYHEMGNGEWLAEAIGRALAAVRAQERLAAERAADRDAAEVTA